MKIRAESEIENMSASQRNIRNIMIGDKLYTADEILAHIKQRTEIGMMFINAEIM